MKSIDEISLDLAVSAHRRITTCGIHTDPKRWAQFIAIIQVAINEGIEEFSRRKENDE